LDGSVTISLRNFVGKGITSYSMNCTVYNNISIDNLESYRFTKSKIKGQGHRINVLPRNILVNTLEGIDCASLYDIDSWLWIVRTVWYSLFFISLLQTMLFDNIIKTMALFRVFAKLSKIVEFSWLFRSEQSIINYQYRTKKHNRYP
jgi:hypothetical protein